MYQKYPRALHLPWSEGSTNDDKFLKDVQFFDKKMVVVTEKMDGENTTMYSDHIHARSVSSRSHPSRNWVKSFHGSLAHNIPPGWRICGENVFAQHSIKYTNLKSYFYAFSIWNDKNMCLDWDSTVEWSELLGLELVPVIYRGVFDKKAIEASWKACNEREVSEGYVVRLISEFPYTAFMYAKTM